MDCIFIGYAHNSSAYRFLVHKSEIPDIHRNTIMESRNACFFEHIFPCRTHERVPRSLEKFDKLASEDDHIDDSGDDQIEILDEPRRSKSARISKSFGPDFLTYMVENEPQTLHEAVNSPESPLWKEAIKSEIDSILQNHTWELVDLPPGCKPLG
mgnify:FL=1